MLQYDVTGVSAVARSIEGQEKLVIVHTVVLHEPFVALVFDVVSFRFPLYSPSFATKTGRAYSPARRDRVWPSRVPQLRRDPPR